MNGKRIIVMFSASPKIISGVFQLQILRRRGESLEHRLVRITLGFVTLCNYRSYLVIFRNIIIIIIECIDLQIQMLQNKLRNP